MYTEVPTRMFLFVGVEWTALVILAFFLASWYPKQACSFTCQPWVNTMLTLFLRFVFMLVILIHNPSSPVNHPHRGLRVLALIGLCLLMSWITAVDYNALRVMTTSPETIQLIFLASWIISTVLLMAAYFVLPFLLPYTGFFQILSLVLLVGVGVLVSWALLDVFHKRTMFIAYFATSLVVFVMLLFSDVVVFHQSCKTRDLFSCDPVIGSTTTYLNLLNILQNLYNLASNLILV